MKGNRYSSVEVLLDRQIGMQPLAIEWAKEEAKMAEKRSIYLCLLLIILFLRQLCKIFRQLNSAKGVLRHDEF